jgi:D-3-phosphoglycerate dehydrogenase
LEFANDLKLVSRVGIGLDGIDWTEIKRRKIEVAYTPDAPSLSVAELTVGFMICLTRNIVQTSLSMRNKLWERYTGTQLSGKVIGIIGLGRIGKKVSDLLKPFNCRIIVNDIEPDFEFIERNSLTLCDKQEIYESADFVTLHVPLTELTHHLVGEEVLRTMKKDAFLVNTSRGSVVDVRALYGALKNDQIKGAALDVYPEEPYSGPLVDLDNVILTCHMGSCTRESRKLMEIEAAQAVVDFFSGREVRNRVPEELRK